MDLDKSAILAVSDLEIVPVEVPEWGGTVYLKGMSGTDRDRVEMEASRIVKGAAGNFRALVVAKCLCDSKGVRMFADADIGALGEKSGKVLDRLFDTARKLSGMTPEDVETLEKN